MKKKTLTVILVLTTLMMTGCAFPGKNAETPSTEVKVTTIEVDPEKEAPPKKQTVPSSAPTEEVAEDKEESKSESEETDISTEESAPTPETESVTEEESEEPSEEFVSKETE